jgi:hypothetical protein
MVSSFDLGLFVMAAVALAVVLHRRALHRRLAPATAEIRYEPVVVLPSMDPVPIEPWMPTEPDSIDLWTPAGPGWIAAPKEKQERVIGLVGLIVMVSFTAALLAFALYESGSVVARIVSRMVHSSG